MCAGIQCIGKKIVYFGSTVLARWQADAVDDQEGYFTAVRTVITIGRWHLAGIKQVVSGRINSHVLTRHTRMAFSQ